MKKIIIFLFTILFLTCGHVCYALVPIESLILGDISSQYNELQSDPLLYLFHVEKNEENEENENRKNRAQLENYLGFAQEGKNLDNFCKGRPQIQYRSPWSKEQVLNSTVATLQYIGLDLTVRAIGKYAKFLEFTPDEFSALTDKLVGNYCSPNVTVISLRELKRNLKMKFLTGDYEVPTVKGNSLFPQKLGSISKIDEAIEQELLQSIKLFRAFCSWGGDYHDLRLLTPLVKHPVVMSFIARQMGGQKLLWKEEDRTIRLVPDFTTPKILCENLVCRKKTTEYFKRSFPLSLGSESVGKDIAQLFCQDFRDADYAKIQNPQVKKWIDKQTFDDENLLIAQFIALATGIPDFFVRSKKFSDAQEFLRFSIDKSFDDWAQGQTNNFSKDLYYEEGLSIEKVDRSLYFRETRPEFKVVLDVNMGEVDKTNQILGKVSMTFNLELSKNLLAGVRERWINVDPRKEKEERELIISFLRKHTSELIEKERQKFIIPPWKGDIEGLIIRELMEQLASYYGQFFSERDRTLVTIPIVFNYGPFALRYIANDFLVAKQKEKAKALKIIDEKLEAGRRSREETQLKLQNAIDE